MRERKQRFSQNNKVLWLALFVVVCAVEAVCFLNVKENYSQPAGQTTGTGEEALAADTEGGNDTAENPAGADGTGAAENPTGAGGDTGEGSGRTPQNYQEVVAGLSGEQAYAYVHISSGIGQALVVADHTYEEQDGSQAGLDGTVYYMIDGQMYNLGTIAGGGDAYPLRYSEEGFFAADEHKVSVYLPDREAKELKRIAFAEEKIDEAGNASYVVLENGEEITAEDNTKLQELTGKYAAAKMIEFLRE